MTRPTRVSLIDVGPRDGLQNEPSMVPTAQKVDLIHALQAAGVQHMEATSFVSPRWVPQMADAAEVLAQVKRRPGVCLSVLTPNMKGLEAALQSGVDEVVVFGAASETFSQKNINCSIAQSMERFAPVVRAAHDAGVATRGAISVAMGCPYEGEVAPAAVRDVAQRMHDIGVQRVAVADTVGQGTPRHTHDAMQAALAVYPVACVTGHFHNTYGQALANTLMALQMGIATFETSVAGLGGCPYSPGATGNVATEDVVYMLHGMGIETGIDLPALVAAAHVISEHLGRAPQSAVARALRAKQATSC